MISGGRNSMPKPDPTTGHGTATPVNAALDLNVD